MSSEVLKALVVTALMTETQLSDEQLSVMEQDLAQYPEGLVLSALTRCRNELRGRLRTVEVVDRIVEAWGHPSGNEAWAMALAARDEANTVVWTEQIAEAMGIAQPVLDLGDETGARMAFREAYDRILRERRQPPRWFASLGSDPGRRAAALDSAVRSGRLTERHAAGLLPAPADSGPIADALFGGQPLRLADLSPEDRERARLNVARLKAILAGQRAA